MKNNRLSGIVIIVVAILMVGGLTYYEFVQIPPKTVVVGAPESDDLGPPGDQPIVPPAALSQHEQPEGGAPEAPSALAAGDGGMAAPTAETPAPDNDATADASTKPPVSSDQPAEKVPAAGMASSGDDQMAAAPTAEAPAAAVGEAPTAPASSDQAKAEPPAAETPAPAGDQQAAATTEPPAAETPAPSGDQQAAVTTEPPAAETPAPAGDQQAATTDQPLAAGTPAPSGDQQAAATADQAPAAGTPAPSGDQQAATTDQPPAAGTPAPSGDQQVATTDQPPAAESPAPAGEQQVATAERPPAAESPASPPAMATVTPVVPTFDVVRVEPTGDTVVAGEAAPDATVEVLDGAAVIATANANGQGAWAIALDHALSPGTHDLAIRTTSPDGTVATLSDERVAVQVPVPGSKDVLVVLNSPDQPSRVLSLPKAGEPAASGGADQVAAADQPAAGEPPAAVTPKAGSDQVAAADQPAAGEPPAAAAPKEGGEMAAAPPAGETPKSGGEVAAVAPQPGPAEPASPEKPVAPATAGKAAPSGPATAGKAGEPAVAEKAPPAKPAPPAEPAPPSPKVVVSAVEADTAGMLYIAGTAATDQPVRVYLDDKPLGEAKPSPSGTWLVEVHREMPAGTYQVRADQVSGKDGTVVARAEVPFEREVDVATLKATGGTPAAVTADVSGKAPEVQTVIIKRGDNLWRIARETWGRGIRWSTLYQANKEQIRNPHWIYPGQVFLMPVTPDIAKD